MNQKLVFVSIIALVAVFAVSAIAIGLGNNMVFAAQSCNQPGALTSTRANTTVKNNKKLYWYFFSKRWLLKVISRMILINFFISKYEKIYYNNLFSCIKQKMHDFLTNV